MPPVWAQPFRAHHKPTGQLSFSADPSVSVSYRGGAANNRLSIPGMYNEQARQMAAGQRAARLTLQWSAGVWRGG